MNIKDIYAQNGLAIQKADYTCGPVSLLNVLRMKGDTSHSEEEVAKLCKAKPGSGTDNKALVNAAKELGLNIIEEKKDASIDDLERNIDAGSYVIVNYFEAFSQDGHFSIVTNYDNRSLYIADCYDGLLRIEKKYFKNWWHNSDKTLHGWYVALA